MSLLILTSLSDGLDISRQKFDGTIGLSPKVHYSQGALNYEAMRVILDPNKIHVSGCKP